ncbi:MULTISPECIES: sensor histidine kinase [unclassified Streptomyces]|uniref:sensor histidine kinase n=1 Tax=unclassified Streptomyces TaxID=2593676 RepID=UPI002E2B3322|nr:nitrate- and nitrite sensing domain-containing protein [Streptomyces sp. NBC_00223]
MRNWRVATRLNAILLIPVLVALVFGGFRVKSSVDTWNEAETAVRTANLVRAAATYGNALENERDVTVVPLLAGKRESATVSSAYAATDNAARDFNEAAGRIPKDSDLQRRMNNFRVVEPQLASLRKSAYTGQLSGVQTEEWYVRIQHPLMELANELGYGTDNGAAYGRTLYAVSLAKAAESLTRSIGMHILVDPSSTSTQLSLQRTSLGSYQYLETIALEEYAGGGTDEDAQRLQDAQKQAVAKGQEQITAAQNKAVASHSAYVVPPDLTKMVNDLGNPAYSLSQLHAEGVTPESYMAASTLLFEAYRSVEVHLADQATTSAATVASDARRDALANSAIVLVALIIAFIVAGLMARSMSRSMRRLRSAAFDIAETRLPALVDQLSRTDPGRVNTQVQPIPINTRDEIGEVARAFDQVHREAVRLAAEQALLRGNVNAIFTNLSQRNQGLIQRQLTLITELENNEADPDQLEHLFKMDHLATRMRRNGENLLVLAGQEPGRNWNQPVPLVDVLRAAASEVEAYDRIELVGIPDTDIHGSAVSDLVHLLAELLENATSFSSPQTKVRITATRLPDGRVMVEIHDKGIGLTATDFADINHKLADPPTVDVEIAKRMGLFVVGRLAERHGIRVQLRPSGEQAGTTSLVMLPEPITHGGGGEEELPEDDRDFTVSRIVPEHTAVEEGAGLLRPELGHQRTAAELGFDDSRYEEGNSLDPVGRSLLREERRAQLGAAAADRQEDVQQPQQSQEQQTAPAYENGGYEPAQGAQGYDQSYDPAYQQQTYEQGFQPGYDQQGYDGHGYSEQPASEGLESYVPQQPQQPDPQPQNGFFGQSYAPQSYDSSFDSFDQGYQQPYDPAAYTQGGQGGYDAGYPEAEARPAGHQAEYSGYSPAQEGWPAPEPEVTESVPPLPQQPSESVVSPSLTDAGLPRRERQQPSSPQEQPAQETPEPEPENPPQPDGTDWRSTNDENWQRAESVREPKAGGVTPSGLPRRVPKANLVPGAAAQTPQGGPQVSRAPEDVRGRLSNLRRGVQQGRTAGTDTNGQATDRRFGGPQNQER